MTNKQSNTQIALYLLVFFVSLYSLTYSGTFVTDDEHILASRALGLAFDHSMNDTRVYGNSRVFALSNLPGQQASQAINVEPGQELLGSLFVGLSTLFPVGHIQFLFLLNIWVTAISVALVLRIVLILGYSRTTACVISILYGLGTTAWVYARTYFRDPLAVLFLLMAWVCLLEIKKYGKNNEAVLSRRNLRLAWIGLIVFLAAGIITKNTIVIAIPVLVIELIPTIRRECTPPPIARRFNSTNSLKYLVILTCTLMVLIVWIMVLPQWGLLARFTLGYYTFLLRFFLTSPHPHFFEALAGPFFSPGKSIFLYSPILILSLISLIRHPKISWSAWLYAFMLVTGQALFYDSDWWGHINWGLRFMLPAIPLLLISAAPVIEGWLLSIRGRIALLATGVISILIQLIGILPPMQDYYVDINNNTPSITNYASLWVLKYSALVWNLKRLLSGGKIDLAATRVGLPSLPVVLSIMMVFTFLIFGVRRITWRWLPKIALFVVVGIEIWMLNIYTKDAIYSSSRTDLEGAQVKITQEIRHGDLVLIKSYSTSAWYYWMNWSAPSQPWTSLPFYYPAPHLINEYSVSHDPEIALDEITLSLLRQVPTLYRRVWLVLPADSPGADLDLEIAWLDSRSSSTSFWEFQGDEITTRLYLFDISPGK